MAIPIHQSRLNYKMHTHCVWETWCPYIYCAGILLEKSKSLCCVLGQNILTQCLSSPKNLNGYQQIVRESWWNSGGRGGNHGIDWHPIQGAGVRKQWKALAGSLGDVARVQNFFLLIVSAFPFIFSPLLRWRMNLTRLYQGPLHQKWKKEGWQGRFTLQIIWHNF